jgi:rubrerythrin
MNSLEKAFWNTSGENISILMPIQKIDAEKRIVSGWATTDVVDKQGDIVSIEASEKAFDSFRGNVREQHTPLAVGKVVSFKRDKYFDKESGEIHNGIFVDVYVSKGAQDTWHKVTERILTGFSIGGKINDTEDIYTKGMDNPIRMIKDYDLFELSLVDNPANPDSNVVSVQKFNGADILEKNYLENVYWCNSSEMVIISEKSQYSCPSCDRQMTNIGFVESSDASKAETIGNLIKSYNVQVSDEQSDITMAIDEVAKSIADNDEKEGINVGILNRNKSTDPAEDLVTKSEEVAEEVAEELAEEVEEMEEAVEEAIEEVIEEAAAEEAVEEIVEKSADEEAVEEAVETSTTPADSDEDLAKSVEEIKDSVVVAVADLAAAVKSIADKVGELTGSVNNVSQEVKVVKGNVEEFGQRVSAIEEDTAVRKSGDLGGIVQGEKINKSMWGGRFLNSADLYR